jgi:2-(1,2-epoxy-1,2-dihydrophenyl)acetyl-CoA isomerase
MASSGCEPQAAALPPIRLDRPQPGLATLTLCRPADRNVITHAWARALLEHCAALGADGGIGAVLLRAEGPAFCVGADVRGMRDHIDELPDYIGSLIDCAHEAVLALQSLPMPVIACVQGVAAGGGVSLALACDSVIAARSARLVMAYPQLGTTPDCGLSHYLGELLGPRRALQTFLMPDALDAGPAQALGLVTQVVDDGSLDEAATALAMRMASLPRAAVTGAKTLFMDRSQAALRLQLEREKASFLQCASTAGFRERVLAFADKRRPPAGP